MSSAVQAPLSHSLAFYCPRCSGSLPARERNEAAPCYNVASTHVAAAVKAQPLVVTKNEIYAALSTLPAVVIIPLTTPRYTHTYPQSTSVSACYVRGL